MSRKVNEITPSRIADASKHTGLAPYIMIIAFQMQNLGMTPEKSITWARSIFEKNPSKKILAAYVEVLDNYYAECSNNEVKELIGKIQDVDEETLDRVRQSVFYLGIKEKEQNMDQVRINFASRLLYLYYEWGAINFDDLRKFTKLLLSQMDKLLKNLAELSQNDEEVFHHETLGPDEDNVSLSKQTDNLIESLGKMLGKQAKFTLWQKENEVPSPSGDEQSDAPSLLSDEKEQMPSSTDGEGKDALKNPKKKRKS